MKKHVVFLCVTFFYFFIYADVGDAKTAGIPRRVQEQPGDGRRANLRLRESARPPPLQQRPHAAARLHR